MSEAEKSSDDAERSAPAQRLYVRVARRICAALREDGAQVGDKLPSETDLAERLQTSRATIREAIVALDVSGVVHLRRGAAAIVSNPDAELIDGSLLHGGGPSEIIAVRLMLEPEAARLAASEAGARACDAMEAAIERMVGENSSGYMTLFGDRDFHLAVAAASGNTVLEAAVADLWRRRDVSRVWRRLEALGDVQRDRTRAVFEHMRVLEAIRAGDGDRAAESMHGHIANTRTALMHLDGLGGGVDDEDADRATGNRA